jgi:Fic family protein
MKAGLLHAQFEAIHPFVDGNGRTGRMLITMYLWKEGLLGLPLLYLSTFFRKHQQLYYEKLDAYHHGDVYGWLEFFFEGVIETAESAIDTCNRITELRERDMQKIQLLGKRSASSTHKILSQLFAMPIVGIGEIVQWTGFTTAGGYNAINRLVDMGILKPFGDSASTYNRKWVYEDYLRIFTSD